MKRAQSVEAEAGTLIRRVLEAVERGELEAGGTHGVALLRRLEGAAVALEAVGGRRARTSSR